MTRALLIVLALLIVPASAQAHSAAGHQTHAAADGQLWAETRVALDYWRAEGLTACPDGVTPSIAPHPDDPDPLIAAWSETGSCGWSIEPWFAKISRKGIDKWELLDECGNAIHEVGHALGLVPVHGVDDPDEARWPIMVQGFWQNAIPRPCYTWARAEVRARKARVRQARRRASR